VVGKRVVPRRPNEREASALDGEIRAPGSERSGLPRGWACGCIEIEPDLFVERLDGSDVCRVMCAHDLLRARGRTFHEVEVALEQLDDALRVLGVVAGRVEVREAAVRDDVDDALSRRARRRA
jgi:hypothetical protein